MRNLSCAVAVIAAVACSGWAMAADGGALSLRKPVLPASYQDKTTTVTQESSRTTVTTQMSEVTESDYMGVSSFFNVRESNSNVTEGEWEVEMTAEYQTGDGITGDDDFYAGASIKYGLSDASYLELEFLPVRLGDGGDHGAGETEATWFSECWQENDSVPGGAFWISARLPTGDGSSGVDASIHGALTKTFADNWRGRFNAFTLSANGGQGSVDEESDRRNLQCGLGLGVDYAFNEATLGVLNYTNGTSNLNGNDNNQVLEVGVVHTMESGHDIKLAFDYGIDNDEDGEYTVKLQYGFEWE